MSSVVLNLHSMEKGKSYHGEIERGLVSLKNKQELWDILETHWTEHAKENSRTCYERVVPSSTGVDGVEDGDSAQESDDEGA